ncbi:efflux transporter outer membrane subunit [Uliginosibacterium sp. H1]|uniref:efflux transporter outer membrane subunit n=1 Tax=Uliginosibacterium sp. H1 TaxID=3114757 RepID=UPI002E17A7FB|nr:efflux transporter outer membrane subunit [Uliginosibacterium sp. H1]
MRRVVRRILPASLGLAMLAVLAACASKQQVPPPEVDMPPAWRYTAAGADPAAQPWIPLLTDPELDELVTAALRYNRDLRAAAARVDQARALWGTQDAGRWPMLSAGGNATRGKQPVAAGVDNRIGESGQVAVLANWELDLWGRIADSSESARQSWLSTEESYRAARVSLVSQVAQGWLRLLEVDEQVLIAENTAKAQRESLRLVNLRFRGGVASQVDVSQAESALSTSESSLAELRANRVQVENALAVLAGRSPQALQLARTRQIVQLPAPATLGAGLPSELLQARPDIRAAERSLAATQFDVSAARKAFLPSISLTGLLGFASYDLSRLLDAGSEAWSVGAGITQPLFTGGALRSQLDLANARQREATERYAAAVLQALREVEDALASYQHLRDQAAAQARGVAANRERLRLADLRYRGGVTDYFEVLNAQQQLFAVELSRVQSERAVRAALIQLYAALGGGEAATDTAPTAEASPPATNR